VAAAQVLLGSSCAGVQLAGADAAGIDEDDDREYFVAAWCVHSDLIPDDKIRLFHLVFLAEIIFFLNAKSVNSRLISRNERL
jgi:hypothetical protein